MFYWLAQNVVSGSAIDVNIINDSMSKYELLSIILSVIAILIPFFQWLYKRFIQKVKFNYYPNKKASLFFNRSGSYVRIDGSFEALVKPVVIQDIKLTVVRRNDNQELNLVWSSFISPMTQSIPGLATAQINETAHPVRITENTIICLFTEFADINNTPYNIFINSISSLVEQAKTLRQNHPQYESALKVFQESEEYAKTKSLMANFYFWQEGDYDLQLFVNCIQFTKIYKFKFNINEKEAKKEKRNIDETLISILKEFYMLKYDFHTINTEIKAEI